MEITSKDLSKDFKENLLDLSQEEKERINNIYRIFKDDEMNEALTHVRKEGAKRTIEVMQKIENIKADMEKLTKKINKK